MHLTKGRDVSRRGVVLEIHHDYDTIHGFLHAVVAQASYPIAHGRRTPS